jgi:hypothetical protein
MSGGSAVGRFAVAALATWRVTHLLASEDGPGDVVVRLRAGLGTHPVSGLVDCFQCLSVWIAAPASLYVTRDPRDRVAVWLALSGAACLLECVSAEPLVFESFPQGGDHDALLRPEASRA